MSIFNFLSGIFTPVANLVDELHTSDEEMGNIQIKKAELQNKLAEIESKVGLRLMELQSESLKMQAKIATAEQEHGNWLSKSWRPLSSLMFVTLLTGMGLDIITFKPLLVQVAGGFLGIYGIGRTVEKSKK